MCGTSRSVLDAKVTFSSMKIATDAMKSVYSAVTRENLKEFQCKGKTILLKEIRPEISKVTRTARNQ